VFPLRAMMAAKIPLNPGEYIIDLYLGQVIFDFSKVVCYTPDCDHSAVGQSAIGRRRVGQFRQG